MHNFFKSKTSNSQLLFNATATIIRTGISTITLPLFTRLLGSSQFGLYSVYASWLHILTCLMGLGCGAGLARARIDYEKNYYGFRASVLLGGTLISLGMFALYMALSKPLGEFLKYPLWLMVVLFVEAFAQYVITFSSEAWTYEKKASLNLLTATVRLLAGVTLSVVFILTWNQGEETLYYGRVFGTTIISVVIALVVWVALFVKKPTGFSGEYWKYSLVFGIPTIFHNLCYQVLSQSDRVMMQQYNVDSSDIGVYSFLFSFSFVLNTILAALNNSWCPFLYDDLKDQRYKALSRHIRNYVQGFCVITCGFLLLSREVSVLFSGKGYEHGLPMIPVFVWVVYSTFMYQFAVNYEFYMIKPKVVAIGTMGAALANILLNAIMIPAYGMYGAAIATLISHMMLFVAHNIIVHKWKHEKYPLSMKAVYASLIPVLVCTALYYALQSLWIVRWALGGCLGVYLILSIRKRRSFF